MKRRRLLPPVKKATPIPTTADSNVTAPARLLQTNDLTYAYRRFGDGHGLPLLCLQHFTGTLDNWNPAVTAPLASGREVILLDNAGVGRSTGSVPDTVAGIAMHALAFLEAAGLERCDVRGSCVRWPELSLRC